jgi:hypothetical protein
VWVTSGRQANLHQNPQAFDRAWIVCSRIFDPRSFLDLNHQTSNPFQHRLIPMNSGYSGY